jgi:DnaJ-class molecular chaperone
MLYRKHIYLSNNLVGITKRTYFFTKKDLNLNHYDTLGVPIDSDYETIKKAYYKLAKENHPDLNPDPKALEKFKEIKKAYEVLGDPNLRIAYDIENNLQAENSGRNASDERYTSRYGRRVWNGPRTIKNFYFNKWTDYKTPTWSNVNTGMDSQTEYILRDREEDLDVSARKYKMEMLLQQKRILIYILFIFGIDILFVYFNLPFYRMYRLYKEAFFNY